MARRERSTIAALALAMLALHSPADRLTAGELDDVRRAVDGSSARPSFLR
ncbi:MAG: hypothetical protein AB7U20_01130 [Planctomycetaceae bacterium]